MKYNKLELICTMWAPAAREYAKFLNRHGLTTICIIKEKNHIGYVMNVYAEGDMYLDLSFNSHIFAQEEKHIKELLNTIERLFLVVFYQNHEEYESLDYVNDDEDII